MCGFTGIFDPNSSRSSEELRRTISLMSNQLVHRGPDDSGDWIDTGPGVGLGFRRLSIVDISTSGHQPMQSACGRYVIAFNGEIYNHKDIRAEIDKERPHPWRGTSDTEVMLAAIALWGFAEALDKFTGMFAFALWDREARLLHLARDRMGEKPLYYGWSNGVFLFGSELKALKAFPGWNGELDRDSLALYLRFCYVPAPYSIYKGIKKLSPGTTVTVSSGLRAGEMPEPATYWSLREKVNRGLAEPLRLSDEDAVTQLERVLLDTVRDQMVADVPLGAFLSGGIDSSLIVSLMQAQSSRPVNTYTIGFNEPGYNEAHYAKEVANHLGTSHTELYVSPAQAIEVIPRLPHIYDEPFSDSSQIPTFLVSQLARQHVTVSLSGDGGDESFGGYRRYILGRKIWSLLRLVPHPARRAMVAAMKSGAFTTLSRQVLPLALRDTLTKIADKADPIDADELYYWLVSNSKNPSSVLKYGIEPETTLSNEMHQPIDDDFVVRMMYLDSISYLPDDIMVKVDRASMSVSLEARAPYLDRRVVEMAWRLPQSMKVRNGTSKWVLRKILYKYVPRELIERPKMGFGVPIGEWMRGPLRSWVEDLLDKDMMREDGIFQENLIHEKWEEHLSRKRNWEHYLWNILMFQAWKRAEAD